LGSINRGPTSNHKAEARKESYIVNETISQAVTEYLHSRGVPLVGVAAVPQIPSMPDDFTPQRILKTARTVVCYGAPIPKGVIYAEQDSLELYWRYCNMFYRTIDGTTNQLCIMLEESGYLASPVYGCFPWKLTGRHFRGFLSLVQWGQRVGLGTLTKSGLLANPRYGTRFLLGGLITSAPLEPSAQPTGDPCPPGCLDCVAACPVNAIGTTGRVDHDICIRYSGANPLLAHLLADSGIKQKFSFETILNTVGVDDHGTYTCNKCMIVCPLNK
jgi:epoxyqueuosine reductase QueG